MGKIITMEQDKQQACMSEIQQILDKYRFTFQPFFTVIGGQMQQGLNLVPKPTLTPDQEKAMRESMSGPIVSA